MVSSPTSSDRERTHRSKATHRKEVTRMLPKKIASLVATVGLIGALIAGASSSADAATPKITMVIKSSTHSKANINWYSNFNYATLEDHGTPYTKKVSTAGYTHSIGATNYTGDTVSLTCVIKYRGRIVKQHTVTGSNVSVDCEYHK